MQWSEFFQSPEIKTLLENIQTKLSQERSRKTIFPCANEVFKAFELTPFDDIKVVILGQDPYHGPNQANGLAFSVNEGLALPPSLKNIYKAIVHDYPNSNFPLSGDLTPLAKQGVFLLNTTLTVEAHTPNSHANLGWQLFTDKVIQHISDKLSGVIFLLWGNYAQKKSNLIALKKHHILTAVHPSPLSAHRGFLTCGHFKKTNDILIGLGKTPIDWQVK